MLYCRLNQFTYQQRPYVDDIWFDGMWHITTLGQTIDGYEWKEVRNKAREIIKQKTYYRRKNK